MINEITEDDKYYWQFVKQQFGEEFFEAIATKRDYYDDPKFWYWTQGSRRSTLGDYIEIVRNTPIDKLEIEDFTSEG